MLWQQIQHYRERFFRYSYGSDAGLARSASRRFWKGCMLFVVGGLVPAVGSMLPQASLVEWILKSLGLVAVLAGVLMMWWSERERRWLRLTRSKKPEDILKLK